MSRRKVKKLAPGLYVAAKGRRLAFGKTRAQAVSRLKNPLELSDEVAHESSQGIGSGSSTTGRRVLEVVAKDFEGGKAFTAHELAQESKLSETSVRKALAELRKKGYVHSIGHALTRLGKKGAERFVGTLIGEERSKADQNVRAKAEGEAILARQIAQEEALADFLSVPRAKPGRGKTYRPVLHRQKTRGHKIPSRTATRIRGAGYRVCNPTESEALARALRISAGDTKQALRFLEGATDPGSRAARNKLLRLTNPKGSSMKKKPKTKKARKARKPNKTKKAKRVVTTTRTVTVSNPKRRRTANPRASRSYPMADPDNSLGFSMGTIPDAPYYVSATDSFMSGWGPTANMRNVVIAPCASYDEAEVVAQNLRDRDEMKRVSISRSKPRPAAKTLYSLFTRERSPRWFDKSRPFKKNNPAARSHARQLVRAIRSLKKQARKQVDVLVKTAHGVRRPKHDLYRAIAELKKELRLVKRQKKHGAKRSKNPLSGVVAAAVANPISRLPVGKVMKWKDAPASVKRDPLAQKAVRLAAIRLGIPMDEVPGEVCDAPDGTPRHVVSSGELVSLSYSTPEGSKDARTRTGRRIVYDHKAGDHGRGKRRTRAALLTNDPRTGHPILVSRRGSRPGFSSRRGQTG